MKIFIKEIEIDMSAEGGNLLDLIANSLGVKSQCKCKHKEASAERLAPVPEVSIKKVEAEPVSVAPVSVAPVSVAPVSVAPVSVAPVSVAPVSVAPVAPTPVAPVSVAPVAPTPVASTINEELVNYGKNLIRTNKNENVREVLKKVVQAMGNVPVRDIPVSKNAEFISRVEAELGVS